MKKLLGHSWKTTLVGYVTAILLALQPLASEEVDFDSKRSVWKYAFRVAVAIGIAIFGKMSADSAQVKAVDKKVEDMQ